MQEAWPDASQRLNSACKVRFTEMMLPTRTINAYNSVMNRSDFVRDFVECLYNNSQLPSDEERPGTTYVIIATYLYVDGKQWSSHIL